MQETHKDKHKAKQQLFKVDENGNQTNETIDRWTAHSGKGIKHLAFVIFVLTDKNEFILHKRPERKVGGGKWDTPASHILVGETKEKAMTRCLEEEYGTIGKLKFDHFNGYSYEETYDDGTCENEFCLVSICKYDGKIKPNPLEVTELKKLPAKKALNEWKNNSEKYTIWFNLAIELLSKNSKGKKYLE